MEVLLSHSFDYLTSSSQPKIRKGLRQLEGLLAQICLSRPLSMSKRPSMIPGDKYTAQKAKQLVQLKKDPAFSEFCKLQDGFQWNLAMRLVTCLEHLMGKGSSGGNDLLIVLALDLMQGVLLLHPPSRELFMREIHVNLLLDLLDPSNCPAIQSSTIVVFMVALLRRPRNVRTFESLDGLLVVTTLFKSRTTTQEVKMKLVEFFYVYLLSEAPSCTSPMTTKASHGAVLGGRGKELVAAFERNRKDKTAISGTGPTEVDNLRTTEDKQSLLGQYIGNVGDLVDDLLENGGPFAAGAS